MIASLAPVGERTDDLTRQHAGEPLGERMTVFGRVFDSAGKPLRNTLVEIWQANACGRYRHRWNRRPAPLDPNFCERRARGHRRRWPLPLLVTIKPGPYPWGKPLQRLARPPHIHFSLLGRAFAQRLVTQMHSPGDPLFPYGTRSSIDPYGAVRKRLISRFSIQDTLARIRALAYEFDIYLRGPGATPFEEAL